MGSIHVNQETWDGYVEGGLESKDGRFLMHEYGHYIQEILNGSITYNLVIAPTSGADLYFHGQSIHEKNWSEIEASTYAFYFFGLSNNLMSENSAAYLRENTINTMYTDGKLGYLLSNLYLNYSYFGKK